MTSQLPEKIKDTAPMGTTFTSLGVIERKINEIIDYLKEREYEAKESYAQGWNEGQQALLPESKTVPFTDNLNITWSWPETPQTISIQEGTNSNASKTHGDGLNPKTLTLKKPEWFEKSGPFAGAVATGYEQAVDDISKALNITINLE